MMRAKWDDEKVLREEMSCEVNKSAKLRVKRRRGRLIRNKRENGSYEGMKKS